jgi:murein DD-endopeptidase MepM/ murein hydrolase activator NlpD
VCLNAALIISPTDEGEVIITSEYRNLCPGEVIKISLQSPVPVSAVLSFDGQEYPFVSDSKKQKQFSLIALGLDMEPGIYQVVVHLESFSGGIKDIPFKLALSAKSFPSKRIRISRRFTSPVPADTRRIKNEEDLLRRVYGKSSNLWLGNGRFIMPLKGNIRGPFGEERVFNGNVLSRHRGIDMRSPHGESIKASNSGEVVLARDLYFSGNTVIISHGIGLFSIYCHMSKILVREGAVVDRRASIGYVGSTGRSTGPHLHWGLKLAGQYADPLSIVSLDFD